MKSVIQAIRAELAGFWDKWFYSQEQREAFSPYNDGGCWLFLTALQELQAACPASSQGRLPSAAEAWGCRLPPERAVVSSPEDYTQTLLELHDAEVQKMKQYCDTHKDLFEAVQKWEENWKLFLELEVLSGQERALPGSVLGPWAAHTSAPTCKVLLGWTREALGSHSGSATGWVLCLQHGSGLWWGLQQGWLPAGSVFCGGLGWALGLLLSPPCCPRGKHLTPAASPTVGGIC
ncbi:uncharacterized protein O3Q21_015514 [Podargus strigoides]